MGVEEVVKFGCGNVIVLEVEMLQEEKTSTRGRVVDPRGRRRAEKQQGIVVKVVSIGEGSEKNLGQV